MAYRKWSVPADVATSIEQLAIQLGYTGKSQRWNLLARLAAYAQEHPSLFRR